MKCTCRIEHSTITPRRGIRIVQCPLCHASQDLLEACKRIIAEYADGDISIGAIEDCQAAVKKAGGE